MPDVVIPFGEDETRQCKGRNPYNSDALVVRHQPESQTLQLIGRVGSTQGLHHGWTSIPDDPEVLTALRDAIDDILELRATNEVDDAPEP
ncbi:MAG: hypothetical protein ABJN42_29830 [Roseibium sp.]|uniref:hypothetical protein n=1 Tax=Roseibium sp. TaxID=1936156 RepID=UPI0032969194